MSDERPIEFVGGPLDGRLFKRWNDKTPPELEVRPNGDRDAPPHVYRLWLGTEREYRYEGQL